MASHDSTPKQLEVQPVISIQVVGDAKFPTLNTPDQAEAYTGIKAARLIDLAEAGYAPHWRIDGGPILFERAPLRRWVRENLMVCRPGMAMPELNILPPVSPLSRGDVPPPIGGVGGLVVGSMTCPGVYFLCLEIEVIYIGQSQNVYMRVFQHRLDKSFDRWYWLPVPLAELNEVEERFIRAIRPKLNMQESAAPRSRPYFRGKLIRKAMQNIPENMRSKNDLPQAYDP
jgi:hypothetical protein